MFLVLRDVKIRYKQTLIGAAWVIIQPLFTMFVFTIFFGNLAKMPSDGIPYPIFVLSALIPWTYFSVALNFSGNSLVANTNLITKVYFPRIAIPAAPVLAGLLDFAIAFVLLIIVMLYFGFSPAVTVMLWPLIMVPLILLTLGTGMLLSALNVKYRDIKYVIPFFIQMWLFITPVIYPVSIIPERYRFISGLNPLSGIINTFRASLFSPMQIDWFLFATSSCVALTVFLIGLFYFKKSERAFADYI